MNRSPKCFLDASPLSNYNPIMNTQNNTENLTIKYDSADLFAPLGDIMAGVFQGDSLQHLMDQIEEKLSYPCLIINTGFEVMADSVSVREAREVYQTQKNGYVFLRSDHVELLRNHYVFTQLHQRKFICRTLSFDAAHNFLLASFHDKHDNPYILLVFLEDRFLEPDQFPMMKPLCQILSVAMSMRHHHKDTFGASVDHLLYEMLEGTDLSHEELSAYLSHLRWIQDAPYYLLVIKAMKQRPSRRHFAPIISALVNQYNLESCIVYDNYLICFISAADCREIEERHDEVIAFLASHDSYAALGPAFYALPDASENLKLTLTVLEAGHHYRKTFTSNADMYDNLMAYLLEQHFSVQEYLHPGIRLLLQYDAANNTDLFDTLEVYLHYRDDVHTAAKLLSLQRSSLFYRIKKIREITDLKLEKLDEIIQLHFSIHLVKLYGKDFFIS